jgi:hypothetical protein
LFPEEVFGVREFEVFFLMSALTLDFIAKRVNGEIRGNQVACPGPGHSPRDRSLCIKIEPGAPGGLIVYSHAQDDNLKCKDFVLRQLGMEAFRPRHTGANSNQKIVATYDYQDADGKLLYQVVRYDPKDFRHRMPDGNGGWLHKGSEKRVPYRLPDLLKYPDGTVFVCEGEKDADRVASLGYCSTTASKWTGDCVTPLRGRDVLILEDNDETGRRKALEAANALHGVAKAIRIVQLPGLAHGADVSDWLNVPSNTKEELERMAFAAAIWEPADISRSVVQSSAQFTATMCPRTIWSMAYCNGATATVSPHEPAPVRPQSCSPWPHTLRSAGHSASARSREAAS